MATKTISPFVIRCSNENQCHRSFSLSSEFAWFHCSRFETSTFQKQKIVTIKRADQVTMTKTSPAVVNPWVISMNSNESSVLLIILLHMGLVMTNRADAISHSNQDKK